jgi:Flp pilus assembly pilin Flp
MDRTDLIPGSNTIHIMARGKRGSLHKLRDRNGGPKLASLLAGDDLLRRARIRRIFVTMTRSQPSRLCSDSIRRAAVWCELTGRARWVQDRSGAVMSEYVILVGVVGLVIVTALVGAGPELLSAYERSRGIMMSPLP